MEMIFNQYTLKALENMHQSMTEVVACLNKELKDPDSLYNKRIDCNNLILQIKDMKFEVLDFYKEAKRSAT